MSKEIDELKERKLGDAFVFMIKNMIDDDVNGAIVTSLAIRAYWSEISNAHKNIITREINKKNLNETNIWNNFILSIEEDENKNKKGKNK